MEIIQPDDWHCHLRDSVYLKRTVGDIARCFRRAIVMPNLATPVTSIQDAIEYRARIVKAIPKNTHFTPLMTLYLTENTTAKTIKAAANSNIIFGVKLYPANATTYSHTGITDFTKLYSVFSAMEKVNLPLLLHGESIDPTVDIFDRESVF